MQYINIPIIGKDFVAPSINIRVTLMSTNQWRMYSESYRQMHYFPPSYLLTPEFSKVLLYNKEAKLEINKLSHFEIILPLMRVWMGFID